MIRLPPKSTRPYQPLPSTSLLRPPRRGLVAFGNEHVGARDRLDPLRFGLAVELDQREQIVAVGDRHRRLPEFHAAGDEPRDPDRRVEIGRAHVWTPVTNAQLVCRLLLEKTQKVQYILCITCS